MMKFQRNRISCLHSFIAVVLLGNLVVATTWADSPSFETMLREAIQNNVDDQKAGGPRVQPKPLPKNTNVTPQPRPVSNEGVNPRLGADPVPASSFKTSRSDQPVPQPISSGWTAVQPNNTAGAVTHEKGPVQNYPPPKEVFDIIVADQSMSAASEAQAKSSVPVPAGASLWDAVPVNVGSEEENKKPEPPTPAPAPISDSEKKEAEKSATEPVVEPVADGEDADVKPAKKADEPAEKPEAKTGKETVPVVKPRDVSTEPSKAKSEEKSEAKEDKPTKEPIKKESDTPSKEETVEPKKIVIIRDLNAAEESRLQKEAPAKTDPTKEESGTEKSDNEKPKPVIIEIGPESLLPDFDSDEDDMSGRSALVDGSKVGDPYAKEKIKLMYEEIVNGMKTRTVDGKFNMWRNYARGTLRSTAGINTGSEVDGRCRLPWYTKLYSDPVSSIAEAEEFSRQMFHGLSRKHRHLAESMKMIRDKLNIAARNDEGIRFRECSSPYDALNEVKRCLLDAQMSHGKAFSTLSTVEQNELANNLVSTFSGQGCINGHTIPNRTYGRRLVDIMSKMDKTGIHEAAESLIPLTNQALLALLDRLPEDAFTKVIIGGQQVQRLSTSAGDIVIGGRGNNVYDLDAPEMRDVVCVLDLGGNDVYREGTCTVLRPLLVIVDLRGDDVYSGSKPGIQGGAVLGISMLIDVEGNDTYSAGDVAQGSTIGGAGMLFDFAGNDKYKALRRAQGQALCGVGLLLDRDGNDRYHAALWAQGFGAPGGFGVLSDVKGNDTYYCGGLYIDSYPEHPGYDGWGQGVGAGIRQVANGGIGMILDGQGDDSYEVDYFGHGGGYWLGTGIARDFSGNDVRHGSTLLAYSGEPRREKQWTRFANGFGCHYAVGYLFDDEGNDTYGGAIMGTGMAWDLALGFLGDFAGTDRFNATGGMTQGVGAEGSIGILYSYGGDDIYNGRNQAFASGGITYHSPSNCGANFSFLINYGGKDTYGSGSRNNSYVQRGAASGFLIDRPTDLEAADEVASLQKLIKEREKEIAEFNEAQEKLKEEAVAKGRRYYPPKRRPMPVTEDQQKRIGAVPHFDSSAARTGNAKVNVK